MNRSYLLLSLKRNVTLRVTIYCVDKWTMVVTDDSRVLSTEALGIFGVSG